MDTSSIPRSDDSSEEASEKGDKEGDEQEEEADDEVEHREGDEVAGQNGFKGEELPESFGGGVANMAIPVMKVFTLAELKIATPNFRPDTMLGEGGFERVFKGWVERQTLAPSKVGVGMPVAVKKASPDSFQGFQEWQARNFKQL
ncbi:probable serine/threonine-protein kinase PBL4 [Malania oleifera]|uniref:probable serine/threonine-protein kinase PBL4 n=1 Tax=Malania oleifera TaxID=397392 RepID=UPI0025AE643B|nr:probable serine/threonine-protein kinase PBL4 [Malania oleifera]